MSVSEPATGALWSRFMPLHQNIKKIRGSESYSMEVYDSLRYFDSFDPEARFNKWAAVQVDEIITVPAGMHALIVPKVSTPFSAMSVNPVRPILFTAIYSASGFLNPVTGSTNVPMWPLWDRVINGEHPESEEDICIPVSAMSG